MSDGLAEAMARVVRAERMVEQARDAFERALLEAWAARDAAAEQFRDLFDEVDA